MKPIQTAKAPFDVGLFVCRKCLRKAGAKQFRKALKRATRAAGVGKVRVIETGCFGLCPKDRIVVGIPGEVAVGRLRVVRPDDAESLATTVVGLSSASAFKTEPKSSVDSPSPDP